MKKLVNVLYRIFCTTKQEQSKVSQTGDKAKLKSSHVRMRTSPTKTKCVFVGLLIAPFIIAMVMVNILGDSGFFFLAPSAPALLCFSLRFTAWLSDIIGRRINQGLVKNTPTYIFIIVGVLASLAYVYAFAFVLKLINPTYGGIIRLPEPEGWPCIIPLILAALLLVCWIIGLKLGSRSTDNMLKYSRRRPFGENISIHTTDKFNNEVKSPKIEMKIVDESLKEILDILTELEKDPDVKTVTLKSRLVSKSLQGKLKNKLSKNENWVVDEELVPYSPLLSILGLMLETIVYNKSLSVRQPLKLTIRKK